MTLRLDLKADFGIDVKIDGVEGTRRDPFRLEPCTADEGALTQLALFRGLGFGRQELWRLLDAEVLPGSDANMQRLRVEAVAFTETQIITETRAYYFDVSRVNGTPNPLDPVPAWKHDDCAFVARHQLGWLHFDHAVDNNPDSDHLDVSLFYSSIGAKATLFIYQPSGATAAAPAGIERCAAELKSTFAQITSLYPNAESPWDIAIMEPLLLQHFLIGDDLSVAGVADLGKYLLKLRLTFQDDLKMRELMSLSIAELRAHCDLDVQRLG